MNSQVPNETEQHSENRDSINSHLERLSTNPTSNDYRVNRDYRLRFDFFCGFGFRAGRGLGADRLGGDGRRVGWAR